MAHTQFFKRSSENVEEYKQDFKKTLSKIQIVRLFPESVISFLDQWIDVQTEYISREDVDNLWWYIKKIYTEKEFYDFIVQGLKEVQDNWKIQEYSFNLISKIHDAAWLFVASEKKRKAAEKLEESILQAQKEDELEMKRILDSL